MQALRKLVKNGAAEKTAERVVKLLMEGKDTESIMQILDLSILVSSGELTRAEINKSMPFNCLKQGATF